MYRYSTVWHYEVLCGHALEPSRKLLGSLRIQSLSYYHDRLHVPISPWPPEVIILLSQTRSIALCKTLATSITLKTLSNAAIKGTNQITIDISIFYQTLLFPNTIEGILGRRGLEGASVHTVSIKALGTTR